jgi:hypothetical protein
MATLLMPLAENEDFSNIIKADTPHRPSEISMTKCRAKVKPFF